MPARAAAQARNSSLLQSSQEHVARQAAADRWSGSPCPINIPYTLSDLPHCPPHIRRRWKKHHYQSIDVDGQKQLEWTLGADRRPQGQFAHRRADPNVPLEVKRGFESQGARVEQQDLQPIVQTGSVRFFEALLIDIPFLVKATLIAIIACLCAFVNLTTPAVTEETIFYTVLVGAAVGFITSFFIYYNAYRKRKFDRLANNPPSRLLAIAVLGHLPTWLRHRRGERMVWLNKAIDQIWEHVDTAVGEWIMRVTQPLMENHKPLFIRTVNFKQCTFGTTPLVFTDAPIIVEQAADRVTIELPFKLNAPDANIGILLGVWSLLPWGQTFVMVKVRNLHVRGTARLEFTNFCAELPCFGALVFALRYPPIVRFKLDLGTELGEDTMVSQIVQAWVDPFLRDFIATMLVWPYRLVIPVHEEGPGNILEYLHMKHRGVLQVDVIRAVGLRLRNSDVLPDPLVRCWLQPHVHEETGHVHKMRNPVWEQRLVFLAQEPNSQFMRLEVYDWDGINLKNLLATPLVVLNLRKSVGSKTFMARTPVPLKPAAEREGRPVNKWYELSRRNWSEFNAPGDSYGHIQLSLRYFSFETIYSKPRPSSKGAVLIKLYEAHDLPAQDPNGLADVYVKFHMAGQTRKSSIKEDTLDPVWNEKFEFANVPKSRLLEVIVWDEDPFAPDDRLGMLEVSVPEDVEPADKCTIEKIWFLADVPTDLITGERKRANIHLRIQWVPFDFPPDG